jgi:predicted enzyme related to lactoylglutathione lyase
LTEKPKVTGIAVLFTVKSLTRTQAFYREVLGLELTGADGYLSVLLPSGTELGFFEGAPTLGSSPQIVFGLEQGGIDGVAERLVQQGVQLVTPVTEAPGGWAFEFGDPDSHKLAFYQDGKLPRR